MAISASERKRDGTYATNFSEFKQKIAAVGLGHLDILKPIAYLGMAYLDWCYPGGGEATVLDRKIHKALFPDIEFVYREYCNRPRDAQRDRYKQAKGKVSQSRVLKAGVER